MAQRREPSGVSVGAALFAGAMMVMAGLLQMLLGIAAIASDSGFLAANDSYFLSGNTTAWGWVHILIGVLVGVAGFAVFMGATWARVIGILLAMLSAVANFLFIPYHPVWAVVVIVIDIIVIYGLSTYHLAPLPED